MDKVLVNLGLKRSSEHAAVEGLKFRTWHSWAALGVAVGVVAGLHHLWH